MREAQKIPWLRIGAESVAIVGSILLAFAIDAGWEYRGDLAEEREILLGLEAEFIDLMSRLDRWGRFNREGAQLAERFLSDSVKEMDLPSVTQTLIHATLVNVLDQGGELDSLLASGRLERIRDRDIRVRLAKWPDWLEDIHTNDLSIREFAMREVAPFLAEYGFPRSVCPEEDLLFCSDPGPTPDSYLRLSADPEFRALLIFRHRMMLISAIDHENAFAEAGELLAMIRARLSESNDQ